MRPFKEWILVEAPGILGISPTKMGISPQNPMYFSVEIGVEVPEKCGFLGRLQRGVAIRSMMR